MHERFHHLLLRHHARYGRNSAHTLPRVTKETMTLAASPNHHHIGHGEKKMMIDMKNVT